MTIKNRIPLTEAPKRKVIRLISISGNRGITQRLAELGLTLGTKIKIIQDSGGPLIIEVRNSKIALGRGMAEKLIVELIEYKN